MIARIKAQGRNVDRERLIFQVYDPSDHCITCFICGEEVTKRHHTLLSIENDTKVVNKFLKKNPAITMKVRNYYELIQ